MTKRTGNLTIPDQVDGETGTAPWLLSAPTDPAKREEHEDKIRRVGGRVDGRSFFQQIYIHVYIHWASFSIESLRDFGLWCEL